MTFNHQQQHQQNMKLSVQRFKEEGVKILHNLGVSKVNARTVIDALVESNMKGVDSHGIGYLPKYIRSITKSNNSISYTSSLNNDNYSRMFANVAVFYLILE